MEKQEKWQSLGGRLGRLRLKIVLGAFFMLAFLLVIAWIAVRSFSNIVASVETLSSARPETRLVNKMIADISEIQAYSGQYSTTKNPAALSHYHEKTVHVRQLIDSLRNESGSKAYVHKLDTLRGIFDEYVVALDEWILIRSQDADPGEYQMYGLIRSGDSSLKHTSQFLPKAEVTQVTKTIEKPIVPQQTVSTPPEKPGRLRTRRNKKNAPAPVAIDSVSKETTTTEITTVVDSSYLSKVDTLLNQMKKTLTKAKNYRSGLRKKMSERESELQQTELVLMERIRTLLDDIEREEAALTQAGIVNARAVAHESYRQLIALGIVALCILLILGITLFSDISKSLFYRRKLQESKLEAERLARVKEEFLANMSHEIRTPINSIIGFTEQLQNAEMHPGKKAKVHAIWRSSNHLLALVNDILDFSKLEAGSLQLEQIGFCYTDVVEEVIEMLEPGARRKNIRILFEPNEASDTMVSGDPVRIKQILLNLVSNAVKFTERGSIHILTEKTVTSDGTLRIICRVKDTGKGIKPGELEKIFRKFEQEDSSVTRHHGGTGLGLSISKKLTELQNGHIWAESCVDVGSTFTFEIPFLPAGKNDYRKADGSTELVPGLLAGRKIAVVDDDLIVVELLGPIFEEAGIQASFFHHPERAWDSLVKDRYDLIFLDLHMPGMDGMELLTRIHNAPESQNRQTPTVLCTANVIKDVRFHGNEKNPDHVLYKPYKRQDVLYIIHRALSIDFPGRGTGVESAKRTRMEAFTLKNFREFAGNDLQLLDNFITLFISESEAELKKLDTHLETSNFRQIGETAHMFKNTYGQLEATAELVIIGKLEILAKEQSNFTEAEIGELILDLQERSKILFDALRREMERLKTDTRM